MTRWPLSPARSPGRCVQLAVLALLSWVMVKNGAGEQEGRETQRKKNDATSYGHKQGVEVGSGLAGLLWAGVWGYPRCQHSPPVLGMLQLLQPLLCSPRRDPEAAASHRALCMLGLAWLAGWMGGGRSRDCRIPAQSRVRSAPAWMELAELAGALCWSMSHPCPGHGAPTPG